MSGLEWLSLVILVGGIVLLAGLLWAERRPVESDELVLGDDVVITVWCPFCDKPIRAGQFAAGEVADRFVYKRGELAYIELAHAECAPDDWRQ